MNTPTLTTVLAACGLALSAFVAPAAHAQAGVISYTDIADTFTGSPYNQINISLSPAINNSGQVAFDALTGGNAVEHIYVSQATGGPTDVAHTGGSSTFTGFNYGLTLNNLGVATFAPSIPQSGAYGAYGTYTGNGALLTKVCDASTAVQPVYGGVPSNADSGAVVFYGTGLSKQPAGQGLELIVAQGGTFTSVVQYDGSQFEGLGSHAINTAGQVAFNTDDYSTGSNNGAFAYRWNPVTHALIQLSRTPSQTVISINEGGTVAFIGATTAGSSHPEEGVFTSNGTTKKTIARINQAAPGTNAVLASFGTDGSPINSIGQVAFLAATDVGTIGIYLGDGVTTTRIAQVGDIFQGRTITQLHLGQDGLNDFGQVTYRADFAGGGAAIIRATTPAPEPSAIVGIGLGTLVLGGLCLRRRAEKSPRA